MSINIGISRRFEKLASTAITVAGSNLALVICFCLIVIWVAYGVFARFSSRWESFIGTVSSVITIIMVFVIQKAQNKASLSIQLKLNELVAAHASASNRLVDVEGMTEDELKIIQKYYTKLSVFAKQRDTLTESHSIDEVHREHEIRKELEEELNNINEKSTKEPDA